MQNDHSLEMFEREPISKLLCKFALPAIASMVVNSIYNIVDQIFIGQGVGVLGNAATNLTFPLVTFSMAIGTMIADGCVAYFSLKLGQKNYPEAARTMGNGISVSLIAGLVLTLLMELLITPILNLCGGTKVSGQTFDYALRYARITLIGIPFVCISMTVNSIIRAQGNPKYAMLSNLLGCFLNITLDAWFVLGLGWGVAGAAWATIIGQALNFVLCVIYIPRLKSIEFKLENTRLSSKTVAAFIPLGISSFFTQFASTIVVICMNNLLTKYGAESVYGADIPLAAQGIVMKVNSIIISVMVGLGIGSQPIVGYNYGAGNFKRVKSTYLRTIVTGLIVGVIGWAIFQFCTQPIIDLFGQESKEYNDFELVGALARKNENTVYRILDNYKGNNRTFSLQRTLSVLFTFFSDVMISYYSPDKSDRGVAAWLGKPEWKVRQDILPAQKNYSGRKVMQILGEIRKTDASSKGVEGCRTAPEDLLVELLFFILH